MKKARIFFKTPVCLILAMAAGLTVTFAQDTETLTKDLIESKHYTFRAQTVNPVSGSTRQLTSDYDLKISGDTIIAYLPYFGRAYAAPADLSGGGIDFTSREFAYKVTNGKKGRWDILIEPKDVDDTRQLELTVFDNGKADLRVTSNNRQPISFNGYITAK